jgi:O-methyltransferase
MRLVDINPAAKAVFRYLSLRHPRWLCRLKMIRNHSIESDRRFWELYAEGIRDNITTQPLEDFFNLYQLVQRTQKLEGEIAELGVYRGGTAKLIATLKGNKNLHLFDTFAGMPGVRTDVDVHRAGDFDRTSLAEVKRYLDGFSGVFFHPGFFPDSARELAETAVRFSLVHLDMDIYESTKAGLEFFYPRMVKGGVILAHDYRNLGCPGVKQAIDEFFTRKSETVIELWKTQCLIIKE